MKGFLTFLAFGYLAFAPSIMENTSWQHPCDAFVMRMMKNSTGQSGFTEFGRAMFTSLARVKVERAAAERYPAIPTAVTCSVWWWDGFLDDSETGASFIHAGAGQ